MTQMTSRDSGQYAVYAEKFASAEPFKYVVIDDFLERALCQRMLNDFPRFEDRYALNEMGEVGRKAVRTNVRFLELMPANASKGTALAILATHLGISPSEAVVFGDGDNDIPMFHWAGLSVAMPHGWPAALQQATIVAPAGPPETAFARGVEMILFNSN